MNLESLRFGMRYSVKRNCNNVICNLTSIHHDYAVIDASLI